MDQARLKEKVENFEILLNKYKLDDEFLNYMMSKFSKILEKAKKGQITTPMDRKNIPLGYIVHSEGKLRHWPDLYNAYAELVIQLQDEDGEDFKKAMAAIREVFQDTNKS